MFKFGFLESHNLVIVQNYAASFGKQREVKHILLFTKKKCFEFFCFFFFDHLVQ